MNAIFAYAYGLGGMVALNLVLTLVVLAKVWRR